MSDKPDDKLRKTGSALLAERLRPISTAEMYQILRDMPAEKSLEDDELNRAKKITKEERLATLRDTLAPLTSARIDELPKHATTLPIQQAAECAKKGHDEPDVMGGCD